MQADAQGRFHYSDRQMGRKAGNEEANGNELWGTFRASGEGKPFSHTAVTLDSTSTACSRNLFVISLLDDSNILRCITTGR